MSTSIFKRKLHPLKQAAFALVAMLLIDLIYKSFSEGSESGSNPKIYWEITAALILFFAMMNAVFTIAYEDLNYYWKFSIPSFALVLFGGCGLAFLFSGMTMNEAGTFKWILMIFSFGYLILMTMVRSMIKIIKMAQREDTRHFS